MNDQVPGIITGDVCAFYRVFLGHENRLACQPGKILPPVNLVIGERVSLNSETEPLQGIEKLRRLADSGHRMDIAADRVWTRRALFTGDQVYQVIGLVSHPATRIVTAPIQYEINGLQPAYRFAQRAGGQTEAVTRAPHSIEECYFQIPGQGVMLQAIVADYEIDNSGPVEQTRARVVDVWQQLTTSLRRS